jgi:hypothetical protein
MALQKEFQDKFGVTHEAAYYRIRRAIVDNFPTDDPPLFTAEIEVYHDQQARQDRKAPLDVLVILLSDPENPAMQAGLVAAYDYLKTLEQFKEAQDV